MNDPLISDWRFKALLASVLFAAGGYLLVSVYSGWQAVTHGIVRVGLGGLSIALGLSLVNYTLRFLRWQMYLFVLGHRLPVWIHLRIYLAGFALTTTPGKAGEAVRSVLLKRFGVPYADSLAALFSERLSDLIGVLLLAGFGLHFYPQARSAVMIAALVIMLGLVLLTNESWMQALLHRTTHHTGRLGRLIHHTLQLLYQARLCQSWRLIVLATLLSLAAWSAEAFAFHWILVWMGVDLSLRYAVFVYALSMLAGAISVMPGGLGGAEAAMVALLLVKGVSMSDAVAATVIIRLSTLWFAVGLGIGALGLVRHEAAA